MRSANSRSAASRYALDPVTGRSVGARHIDSPNFDARPPGMQPELIVVHGISLPPGEFGGPWIDDLFMNNLDPAGHPYFAEIAGRKVSAHYLVRRSGELVQYVSCNDRAWHAGTSSYQGRGNCNDFSIGIELEGTDGSAYEPQQYRVLTDLILTLCDVYPSLSTDRIAGHSDVAPGRKSDPGPAFDWPRLHALLAVRRAYG
jgi:N-acetyl-anhydromuramoyl-L-alanine amidase